MLAKFTIALQKALAGKSTTLLEQSIAKLMVTPAINQNMGLGFETNINRFGQPVKSGQYFMHPGQDEGYSSLLLASRYHGNGIIIMTNVSPTKPNKLAWQFIFSVVRKVISVAT